MNGYSVGFSEDCQYVTINIPGSGTEDAVQHPPFTLLLTAEQAFAFAKVIEEAASLCVTQIGDQ